MAGSTASSVTRYRPAVLVVTGAAAAYAAWLLYTSIQAPGTPPDSLQRSNAIRRTNRRARNRSRASATSRVVQRVQQDSIRLGTFDFFGHHIELDAHNVVSADHLREVAHQVQPTASREMVDDRISQLYDTFYHRLLGYASPERPLSDEETDLLTRMVVDQGSNPEGLVRAMERHRSSFALSETEALLTADGIESIAATEAFWPSDEDTEDGIDPDGQTLQRTLYHIAEDRARHEGVIHRGITCNGCDAKPIRGIRWRCANCADYDLCSDCEATNSHVKTHIFYKIRVPAPYMGLPKQEAVYPGRPWLMTPSVDSIVKKDLVEQTRLEMEEIEALWDQFTCLASTEWTSDPDKIGWALDRRAFDHAFVPHYASFTSAPNLVYDRIFAYFDTDLNGLIGFREFIKGLDGLHSSDTSIKQGIAFNGYDIDGDGYISRKDVLRIFRAHYAIVRESTRNYLAEAQEELSIRGALETIRSAQPLGAAFTQGSIPSEPQSNEHLREKDPDANDLDPNAYDVPDTMSREDIIVDSERNGYSNYRAQEAVIYRWDRRQFYIDEEEGLTRPAGAAEDGLLTNQFEPQIDGENEATVASDSDRRRESRSSSRVRFQDDIDVETRSNASTSSRPIGERWGGYEVPEPEKDLGTEVLYQITQQGFNELLDPLFKKKEDAAMDAYATRDERRLHVAEIEDLIEQFKVERENNAMVLKFGSIKYAELVTRFFCAEAIILQLVEGTDAVSRDFVIRETERAFVIAEQHVNSNPDAVITRRPYLNIDLWDAKLCRTQILHEITKAMTQLLNDRIAVSSASTQKDVETNHTTRDPTMPQFRPNSTNGTDYESPSKPSQQSKTEESTPSRRTFGPLFVSVPNTTHNLAGSSSSSQADPNFPATLNENPATDLRALDDDDDDDDDDAVSSTTPPPPFLTPQDATPSALTTHQEMHLLSLSPDRKSLLLGSFPNPCFFDPILHPEAMQAAALADPSSPMHLPYLACLETVNQEISERRGSGLLSFEEFVESVETGRWRFLECWMDLVSF